MHMQTQLVTLQTLFLPSDKMTHASSEFKRENATCTSAYHLQKEQTLLSHNFKPCPEPVFIILT